MNYIGLNRKVKLYFRQKSLGNCRPELLTSPIPKYKTRYQAASREGYNAKYAGSLS